MQINPPKDVKQEIEEGKLRRGVNCLAALEQKGEEQG
jgi:hypothetical protein